jgi:predicted phage baseplate assembly protein
MYIKDALFHEVTSPLLTLKRAPQETTLVEGRTLNFKGTASEVAALDGRRILLDRPGDDPAVVDVLSVPAAQNPATAGYPALRPIVLSAPVIYAGFPNANPITTVFGNLADATEGKTLAEIPIGSGDASQIFQTFKLPKAPLTYHIVAGNTPAETPQLSIYVDGREWTQVESLFGRRHDERAFIVREDAEGKSWVQFGDGKTGSRLTNGVDNVAVVYRIGAGSYGPLKPETKVQASATLKNLDKVSMPADVTGGAPSEGTGQARDAAPGKVQSLGRIVSLRDFEAEAAAIPGVALAGASWQLVDGVPAVEVTVLMETGRGDERQAVANTLNAYNMQRGAGRDAVSVVFGSRLHVTAAVEYALAPTFRSDIVDAAIRRALGVNFARATRDERDDGLFSLRQRRFGEREYASRIAGRVQNVEGVRWARTTAFASLTDGDDAAAIVLPPFSALDPIVACDSRHILSLFDAHLTLTVVKETGR